VAAFSAIALVGAVVAKKYAGALFSDPEARSARAKTEPGKAGPGAFADGKGAETQGGAPLASPMAAPADAPLEWQAPMRNYPRPDTFSYKGDAMVAEYAPDSLLNARVNLYLQRYRPETGVILISDLRTGHVLAMGERADSLVSGAPRLAFGGGYPAASLVKILTATAALECKAREVTDSIPLVGRAHTLYKRQIKLEGLRNIPRISLEQAFSRSVNPSFGVLGMSVGSTVLRATAARMGFNRPMEPTITATSRIEFPDTGFSLAEAACGFTPKTTISPWHALQIARGAGDDGRLRPCRFVHRLRNLANGAVIEPGPGRGEPFISAANLPQLQDLMRATVRVGTARKGFHQNLRASQLEKIEAGGKTGSLDGEETPGRFDWFIGYVKLKDEPERGLAISIMLVHVDYASIHASAMAALLIRDWLAAHEKALRQAKTANAPLADQSALTRRAGPG
jgi:cell division protein FtsI/penicillin-binding protein 2